MSIRFLWRVPPPGLLQHGQKLGGLGAVGWGIIPGYAGALNEERGAVQGEIDRVYRNHLLDKTRRPCYNWRVLLTNDLGTERTDAE